MDLKKARENEEKLKEAQTEEMREVENYVEHIRHLSDEREALIQELETENEQLKNDLEQARSELSGMLCVCLFLLLLLLFFLFFLYKICDINLSQ
jgi:uncharacterized membrane protein